MLHIHNGDSSAGIAKKANIPGDHLAWREALVCGPAPAGLSADDFRILRAKHLAEDYDVDVDKCATELRTQEEKLGRFVDHEEVVLWFEHDLFCQVQMVYLLDWFSRHDLGKTKLSLICIDRFPGVENFRGLGQLSVEQMESLVPQRTTVDESQMQLGANAWAAYSSSTPTQLETLISAKTNALPFLKTAFVKHLERFPSVRNGLGRIENVLLELIAGGRQDFNSLFSAFQQKEPAYGFGDAQIFLHLRRLVNAADAPLTTSDTNVSLMNANQVAGTSFEITETGKRLLRGEVDFARSNGTESWLGGVHIQGKHAGWRWDETWHRLQSVDSRRDHTD
jgi:hypothetical protein